MTASGPAHRRPIGILLAAGRGRRMGAAKLLLPWPPDDRSGRTVVSSAFDAIAPWCAAMVVVTDPRHADLAAAMGGRAFLLAPGNPDADMLDSVRKGLGTASALQPEGPFLIQPADHPDVALGTVRRLLEENAIAPTRAIMPAHQGKGGHPVLVPANLVKAIRDWEGNGGLAGLWRARPEEVHRFECRDPSCIKDLDTPADYHGKPE
ncbi:MAG: nucleotidyltransferase family protein [Phycisphaerales bacterium]|nr:nucleotidyltransferase family protein [Phycisphaerales bacterium]